MILAIRPLVVLFVCLLAALQGLSQGIRVEAKLGRDTILIGDPVDYTLRVISPPNTAVVWPNLTSGEEREGVELLSQAEPKQSNTSDGYQLHERVYRITAFDAGQYPLKQFVVLANGDSLSPPDIKLEVKYPPSFEQDSTLVMPIKPILDEALAFSDVWPWLALAAGIILLALLIWWFIKRKRDIKPQTVEIQRTPHEIALEKLGQIERAQLWQDGLVKEYYTELTYVLREYIEARYHMPALESTTAELLPALRKQGISKNMLAQLEETLLQADMVKFAKFRPDDALHLERLNLARNFVNSTIPQPEVSTEKEKPT
jgi:hypothetical protein